MNILCKKDDLLKIISKADKITSKNLSLPVLQGIYVEAKNGEILIRATNLDVGFEAKIKASIKKEGSVVVPSNLINNFLSNIQKNENIEIISEGQNILINSERNQATIRTLSKEDFPSIPKIKEDNFIKIEAKKILKGLKTVLFSASVSSIKPELASIYIRSEEGKLFFVSTDSFRLSEKTIKLEKNKDFEGVLVPQKNISEIIRSIEDIEEEIEIFFDENQIALKTKDLYILSRIIDGTFPDYNQIIPKEFVVESVILKEDFINALKISNVFTDKLNQTRIKINPKQNILEIETQNKEYGLGKTTLKSEITGDSLEINFNHKYIQDCLPSLLTESVKLSLAGPGKPMLITGVGDNSFKYIVMPMNK